VERREASADCKPRAASKNAAVEEQRLSAFCILYCRKRVEKIFGCDVRRVPIVMLRFSTAAAI
jgi:hypothetical protein